ncbi:hypothetical protein JCM10212_002971 [Sporobolomyces blumeae]
MQTTGPPRLRIGPPFPDQPADHVATSPAGPYFSSPATYSPLPFGQGTTQYPLVPHSPAVALDPTHFGFFPSGRYAHAQGGAIGYGPGPTTGLGFGSTIEPHAAMRSSSSSSYSSTSSFVPPAPAHLVAQLSPPAYPLSHHLFSPPLFHGASPPPPASPPRTKLDAHTPSFQPRLASRDLDPHHHRSTSLNVGVARVEPKRPVRSRRDHPTRKGSTSVSVRGIGTRPDEDVKVRKKIVVRVPVEGRVEAGQNETEGTQSRFGRNPLDERTRKLKVEEMERDLEDGSVKLEEDELVGKVQHFDEVRLEQLPPTIDVFLPALYAWDEVWDGFVEDTKQRGGSFDIRKPDFLNGPASPVQSQHRRSPSAFPLSTCPSTQNHASPPHRTHTRGYSLFDSPVGLPARLQTVLDNLSLRRNGSSSPGHAPSASFAAPASRNVSGPIDSSPVIEKRLTPFARTFTMPSWSNLIKTRAQGVPLPDTDESLEEVEEKADGVDQAVREPDSNQTNDGLESSATPVAGSAVDHEPQDSKVHEIESDAPTDPVVVFEMDDEPEGLETTEDRSVPSRRTSGVSTKTDHTGVASISDGFSDVYPHLSVDHARSSSIGETGLSDRVLDSPEDSPVPLNMELSRALSDLGPLDVYLPPSPQDQETPAQGPLVLVEEGDANESDLADGESSEGDLSDKSDAEVESDGRQRALDSLGRLGFVGMQRDKREPVQTTKGSALSVEERNLLFQAPSDVDRSPTSKATPSSPLSEGVSGQGNSSGGHRVNERFEFPARSPSVSPIKARPAAPTTTSSSPSSSRRGSPLATVRPLDPAAPGFAFTFGRSAPFSLDSPTAFGENGAPGPLASSPPPSTASPPPPPPPTLSEAAGAKARLNPIAPSFEPTYHQPLRAKPSFNSASVWGLNDSLPSTRIIRPEPRRPPPSILSDDFIERLSTPVLAEAAPTRSFDFQPPSYAPTLPQPITQSLPGPRRVSHGPLPPIPSSSSPASWMKRQKLDGGFEDKTPLARAVSHPNIAPRRPLPTPPLVSTSQPPSGDENAATSDVNLDYGSLSIVSLEDPLPPQYKPGHPVPRVSNDDRPFTLRPAASFSTDGRILGFKSWNGPENRFDSLVSAGENNGYDGTDGTHAGGAAAHRRDQSGNVYEGETLPFTPIARDETSGSSVIERSEDGSSDGGSLDEEDDMPLRILEGIIERQFDGLRRELRDVASTGFSAIQQDALVDSFADRVEALLSSSSTSRIPRLTEPAHPAPLSSLAAPVAFAASIQRVSTPALEAHPAAAYSVFLDDLRATVQPLVQLPPDARTIAAELAFILGPQHVASLGGLSQASHDKIVGELENSIKTSLKTIIGPCEDDETLSSTILSQTKEHALSLASSFDSLDAKVVESAGSVRAAIGQLGLDVTSRLDTASSALEKRLREHLDASHVDSNAKILDLENQLAKSRNDHGKARTEKAVLQERLDADKFRSQLELELVRSKLASADRTIEALEAEKSGSIETIDKLQSKLERADQSEAVQEQLAKERGARREAERQVDSQALEIAELRQQLDAAKRSSGKQGEVDDSRRELDRLKGEVGSLEKRLAAQDKRLESVLSVRAAQQQLLSRANRTVVKLEKEVAAAGRTRLVVAQLETVEASLVEQLEKMGAERDRLAGENDEFRRRFKKVEEDLVTMKAKVAAELGQASARIEAVTSERDRLAAQVEQLLVVVERQPRVSGGAARSHGRHSSTETVPAKQVGDYREATTYVPETPPPSRFFPTTSLSSAGFPATPETPSKLFAQLTGSSVGSDETVPHTDFSPAPSSSGRSFTVSHDGWYSIA